MNKTEFKKRRRQLMAMMGPKSIAFVPAAEVRYRNRDAAYRYRQDSDFYYLTGFPEANALAVLFPGRKPAQYILFCSEHDAEKERLHGVCAGIEGARRQYGADDAFPIDDIDEIIPGLLEHCERVYYPMGCNKSFDQQLMRWINQLRQQSRSGVNAPTEFISLDHILHDMRLIKNYAEICAIQQAISISEKAHIHAMTLLKPGMLEYELEAEILYIFMRNGVHAPAYTSIVAGGANSCTLHYIDNNKRLKAGDLVVIDAGAEYDHYAADIARTLPVSGHFTHEQKAIYEIVLQAQTAAIETIAPNVHWNEPHQAAVLATTKGLVELGLLQGRVSKLIKDEAYKRFFMHRTGHWLGMDVHDVGDYMVDEQWRILEPGMVFTVEPGIYIPAGSQDIAKKWWNIGIRIEDNVVVTQDGYEILSSDIPRTVADIEAVMA